MLYNFFFIYRQSFETRELLPQSTGNFDLKMELIVDLCHALISAIVYKIRDKKIDFCSQDISLFASLDFNKEKNNKNTFIYLYIIN